MPHGKVDYCLQITDSGHSSDGVHIYQSILEAYADFILININKNA